MWASQAIEESYKTNQVVVTISKSSKSYKKAWNCRQSQLYESWMTSGSYSLAD